MKRLIVMLLVSISAFAQETEFKFTKDGFTDFVVTPVEGKTQAELYKKTLDWVAVTYNNPKEVIKAQIENDYIRIEGSKKNLVCVTRLIEFCYNTRYQIEISFKEGKYKFDVIKIEYYTEPSKYGPGGWYDFQLNDMNEYFKKSGDPRGAYENCIVQFPKYFNDLNIDLSNFLKSTAIPSKKSDW